jgi:hypothetical protein
VRRDWLEEKRRRMRIIEELKRTKGEGVQEIKCKHCDAIIKLHYPPEGEWGVFMVKGHVVAKSFIPSNPDEPTKVATTCPNGHWPVYVFDWNEYRYKER